MSHSEYCLKYVLVGSSGSGKSTMAHILEQEYGLRRCITSTTRPPRAGETDGVDYHFRNHLNPEEMFEHAAFGGYEYGITRDELTRGDFIILDPQGVSYYRKHYHAPLTIIQLVRDNIQVGLDRMARDRAAGFDQVHPDFIVRGETVEEMAANLIAVIRQSSPTFSQKLDLSQPRTSSNIVDMENQKNLMHHR